MERPVHEACTRGGDRVVMQWSQTESMLSAVTCSVLTPAWLSKSFCRVPSPVQCPEGIQCLPWATFNVKQKIGRCIHFTSSDRNALPSHIRTQRRSELLAVAYGNVQSSSKLFEPPTDCLTLFINSTWPPTRRPMVVRRVESSQPPSCVPTSSPGALRSDQVQTR